MLLRSGLLIASITLLSRVFGMFRELFVAATFGTNATADSVNIAFKLPNLFRRILGEGALASVFVPIFASKVAVSEKTAMQFANKIFFILMIVTFCIIILMQYFMPELMAILAPGFTSNPQKFEMTVLLCRITIIYVMFISLTSLLGGMTNTVGKFAPYAATAIVMNIVIIIGTYILSDYMENYYAIAISVIIAGIIQLFLMWLSAYRAGLKIKFPQLSYKDEDVIKLLKLMGPATITAGVVQINLFISQSISSYIPGAVSILSYADRLYQLPMSIVGVTFGTVLLPTLSKLYKTNAWEEAKKTQEDAIKIGLFLTLPCSIFLLILAHPTISLIYEYGAFTHADTIATGDVMAAFAFGLPAFVLSKIFMPIFYANQDTKTPMKITIYTIIANLILNLILMRFMGATGIALGSTIASWFGVYISIRYAKKMAFCTLHQDFVVFIIKTILCTLLCGISMWLTYEFSSDVFDQDNLFDRVINVFSSLIVGFALYIVASFFTGILSKKMLLGLLRKKEVNIP